MALVARGGMYRRIERFLQPKDEGDSENPIIDTDNPVSDGMFDAENGRKGHVGIYAR